MDVGDKLYILRLIMGIIFGAICGVLGLRGLNGLYVGLLGYVASYYVARLAGVDPLSLERPIEAYSSGAAPYFGAWIIVWTLAYNLLHALG